MSYDNAGKIAVNGVDLVNRHELSNYQQEVLQRYIDENAHLLYWKDREIPPEPPKRVHYSSNYSTISRDLSRGASPAQGYSSIDRLARKVPAHNSEYSQEQDRVRVISPSIEHANYVTDFPGIENSENDNEFLLQLGGGRVPEIISRPGSAASQIIRPSSAMSQSSRTYSNYGSMPRGSSTQPSGSQNNAWQRTNREWTTTTNRTYHDDAQSLPRSTYNRSTAGPSSAYSTLKRVSWYDQDRARSFSPQRSSQPTYGRYV